MFSTPFKSNILCETDPLRVWWGGRPMCPYDTIKVSMKRPLTLLSAISAALLLTPWSALSQPPQEATDPLVVGTDHPRLFLRPARLRLLKRERERTSMRWQQFEILMAGHAPMPEPGFADALYYQVSGNAESGKRAVAWALGPGADLRQLALVFDWCQ